MKQMITRLDDDLHARVKAKAAAEGVSVNELVSGLLEAAVGRQETREEWKKRMIAEGKILAFEPDAQAPSRDEVAELLRGAGPAVLEHLEWSRGEW